MWRKQKKNHHNNVTCIDTLIASDVTIEGDLHFRGGVQVDGTVHGNIIAEPGSEGALVRVTRSGRVCGDIEGPNVVINGRIEGNVKSYQHLELAQQAIIFGSVHYNLIEMVVGAEVNGNLYHITEEGVPVQQDLERTEPATASETQTLGQTSSDKMEGDAPDEQQAG